MEGIWGGEEGMKGGGGREREGGEGGERKGKGGGGNCIKVIDCKSLTVRKGR